MTVLLVIGILVSLIIVHELGHFFAAKIFGVKVDEFGVGYPPRALTFGKWGGTEYTLNWLPFGGFVRLFGESEQEGEGSFVGKNRGMQAVILFAGVFMNLIAAWALFAGALYIGTPRVVETIPEGGAGELLVAEVIAGSPAATAGIAAGDRIRGVESAGNEPTDMTPQSITDFVQTHAGEAITIVYERGGEESVVTVHPAHAVTPEMMDKPAVGVALVLVTSEPLPLFAALKGGITSTVNALETVTIGLWHIARDALSGGSVLENLVGPVGLVGVAGLAAETGIGQVLTLAAFISINLFVINLLPIPALDGGRLFILGIESVMRRAIPHLATRLFNSVGIALLILLMVIVTWNDVARLVA